jgi:hypothetical protein
MKPKQLRLGDHGYSEMPEDITSSNSLMWVAPTN